VKLRCYDSYPQTALLLTHAELNDDESTIKPANPRTHGGLLNILPSLRSGF
jgi:hypothetical protein